MINQNKPDLNFHSLYQQELQHLNDVIQLSKCHIIISCALRDGYNRSLIQLTSCP